MDLDALGLNSTFESTELDHKHQPNVDVVETSDIEGPEDFTMNMTYWMTADLPLAQQIRSRKEAKTNTTVRHDQTRTEGGNAGEGNSEFDAEPRPASTATRVNGTAKSRSSSKAPSEASMENEEKVRSYLSALPDSDLGGNVLTSTPLRIPKQNMLQVPSPSPARARSLQPTVEDYDTPRKPTQETVIHNPPERIAELERKSLQEQVAELQSRLQGQEHASKIRITELETLLSYTRSDLDTARTESYKQKDHIEKLQKDNSQLRRDAEESRASIDGQLKVQEEDYNTKLKELGEELRLQNNAALQRQREEFEQQLRTLEEAKRTVDTDVASSGEAVALVKNELGQLRDSHERELRELQDSHEQELQDLRKADHSIEQGETLIQTTEVVELQQKFAALQKRANALQADLERAAADTQLAREEALASRALHASSEGAIQSQKMRASELQSCIDHLESQVASAHEKLVYKDQQLEEQQGLESQIQSLRRELEDAQGRQLANETDSLDAHLESRLMSVRNQLESARNDVKAKNQEVLKQFEEHERLEQRLSTAQGRIESLETTASSLRQQLAEAHRGNAKTRTDAEQLEGLLDDANERLQDARAEADRRVADVEKRLSKLRDIKVEVESRLSQLQSELDDSKDDMEAQMEAVRDTAEDAIRKAGALLEKERAEKRRATKELKKTVHQLEQLRAEAARKNEEGDASEEESSVLSSAHDDPKDAEIENLRILVRKQASSLKTLKSETSSLRKEATRLKDLESSSQTESITDLRSQIDTLRRENKMLKTDAETREQDFMAVNKAMDERLAAVLSKAVKERAKTVVNKRDGQWAEKMQGEREFMGKVLMREWGRQEVGVAQEGEKQGYRYKYVQRS
jgi:chromosome segregation ATPase